MRHPHLANECNILCKVDMKIAQSQKLQLLGLGVCFLSGDNMYLCMVVMRAFQDDA